MACVFTVLYGIVVLLLAGSSCSVSTLTLEEQFQQFKSDCVLTKELLKNNIIRLEKQQARLEVEVQKHNLLAEVFERRVSHLEASAAKMPNKMTEPESKVQEQEEVASVPRITKASATPKPIANDVIELIQQNKGPLIPIDAASAIPPPKRVIGMDYSSMTLGKVSSCKDPRHSQQCEREE